MADYDGGKTGKKSKSKEKSGSAMTKTQLVSELAFRLNVDKKLCNEFLTVMEDIIHDQLKEQGVAAPLPGLLKVVVAHRAAKPAREGRNPATGATMMFKAKPASKVVKVRPMKRLKEMI